MSDNKETANRLPRWLKRKLPKGNANHFTARLVNELGLETVCDHARCPNRMECYSQKTATFMILGDVCTRGCAFCSVATGSPRPVDEGEPERIAQATAELKLRHVVVTCVTRDDLPDGGAGHFARVIRAVRESCDATIEVLTSDFGGKIASVDRIIEAQPDVFNHNTETVPRLYRSIRTPQSDFRWTLSMFRHIREAAGAIHLKTGLMLGLGETREELLDTLAELLDAGCGMLTLGQYLRPSPAQIPVVRYVPPDEFDTLKKMARGMGFSEVAAGPFVRSSYHAREMMISRP